MHRSALGWLVACTLLSCTGPQGPTGPAGAACTVVDNADGTKTVTCGTTTVTIANGATGSTGATGAQGTSCSVADAGGGSKTISCTDNTSVTVTNGSPCAAVSNGDGTHTLTCPNSTPVTVLDGTSCSIIDLRFGVTVLSCTDGKKTLVAPPLDPSLEVREALPGLTLTVAAPGGHSNTNGSFHPGDRLTLTFTVKTRAGRVVALSDLTAAGAWVSGPNTNYQHVLPVARDATMADLLTGATLNDDGSYTWKMDALPANFGTPLFDTPKFTDGELSGPLTAGTYTLGMMVSKDFTVGGAPATDATALTVDFPLDVASITPRRELVVDVNCNGCHKEVRAHGGAFRKTALCVTCHTAGAEDEGSTATGDLTPQTIEFEVMLHKLHNGYHLPSVVGITVDGSGNKVYGTGTPFRIGDADFSAVQFPIFPNFAVSMPKDTGYSALTSADKSKEDRVLRGVTDCSQCHGDPDGAGPLLPPDAGTAIWSEPNKRACGSCHDDLDYTKPYVSNGATMPANTTEAMCTTCHQATALANSHVHPDSSAAVLNAPNLALTAIGGASGTNGRFLAGDKLTYTFTVADGAGAALPMSAFDSFTLSVLGPTQNRQVVFPGLPGSPFDFTGRLQAASTTNKGIMSKAIGATVTEVLTINFTSAGVFDVVGSVSGPLGTGVLPGSPGTYPSGASMSNVVLAPTAVAQGITVTFSGPTTYSVSGTVSGPMGSGTLPASVANTQRFTSTDGTVAFNLVVGTTAPAAGNAFYLSVVKGGAANPVLFAVVGGRTAFAYADRFYEEVVAPASSYTFNAPMDLPLEFLGRATGVANETFTAANLPVYFGRQQLFERMASVGTATTLTKTSAVLDRFITVAAIDPALAASDYLVIDDGTATEEYVRVSSINATTKLITLASGLRYAHGLTSTAREVTLTFRQEGASNYYTLNAATGVITLTGTGTAGNAFVMTYRTDARFGWAPARTSPLMAVYAMPLVADSTLDETEGDWHGKPMLDGTYTASVWGYRSVEFKSGATTAPEWQTYRASTPSSHQDFLFGNTTSLAPYSHIPQASQTCNGCHGDLSFHGAGRRSADTCLTCHSTSGLRHLIHGIHATTLPVMPNGSASCDVCHGRVPEVPESRKYPTGKESRDWGVACTSCHTAASTVAHAETMTAPSNGLEACLTCHGVGKDLSVLNVHRAR
ncbi:MAG: cytochrome c3 family protein [Myxococcaceae bacterium]